MVRIGVQHPTTSTSDIVNRVQYSWSDGNGTAAVTGRVTGAAARGAGNGFEVEVSAGDASVVGKILELSLYSGIWESVAKVHAELRGGVDGTTIIAPVFEDVVEAYFVRPTPYVFRFRCTEPGAKLVVSFVGQGLSKDPNPAGTAPDPETDSMVTLHGAALAVVSDIGLVTAQAVAVQLH
jgi:hypothetical protein